MKFSLIQTTYSLTEFFSSSKVMLALFCIKGYIKVIYVICEICEIETLFNYSIDLINYQTISTITTKA